MKKALMAASLVLMAGALVGCGGGDADGGGAPTDASEKDFCEAYVSVTADTSGDEGDTKAQIQAAKDAAGELADVGTPSGMPDDARQGFEVLIDLINGVDDDASSDELDKVFDDISADDQKAFVAFTTYVATTCADQLGS